MTLRDIIVQERQETYPIDYTFVEEEIKKIFADGARYFIVKLCFGLTELTMRQTATEKIMLVPIFHEDEFISYLQACDFDLYMYWADNRENMFEVTPYAGRVHKDWDEYSRDRTPEEEYKIDYCQRIKG